MRLPQSRLQSLSVYAVHLITIGTVAALLGILPAKAGATIIQLASTPSNLRFGDVIVGQTETLLVTVTNNGQTSVTI